MARYVVIKNGSIVNVVEWDGTTPWSPTDGGEVFPHETGGIGWNWNDGSPTDPSPPPPPPPPPIDLSNIDNLEKTFQAMGLLLRDYTNGLLAGTYTQKTIAQLKSDFKTKYNALP